MLRKETATLVMILELDQSVTNPFHSISPLYNNPTVIIQDLYLQTHDEGKTPCWLTVNSLQNHTTSDQFSNQEKFRENGFDRATYLLPNEIRSGVGISINPFLQKYGMKILDDNGDLVISGKLYLTLVFEAT